ncbi:MAG: GAF domain-containing protein, partial [bacterium]|nr:GAF domain-containing protein [bacterium]
IRQAMRATHIFLLLPSHSTDDFEVITSDESASENSQLSVGRNNPLIKHLETQGKLLHREDLELLSAWEVLPIDERDVLEKTAGEIFVPLNSGERLIGLLILGPSINGRPYSWEDERLLGQIASQMALTIENIQLYQASLERERQLAALSRLNNAMSASLDFQSAYDVFADELKKTIPVDWASIVLSEKDELHFFALSTAIDSSWGQPGTVVPLAGTATEWVALNKKTMEEPDLARKSRFWSGSIHLEQGIRSIVYLPLFSKGEVFGSFTVGSSKANAYTRSDIMFLEQVSTHLSLTMENARLYSRER